MEMRLHILIIIFCKIRLSTVIFSIDNTNYNLQMEIIIILITNYEIEKNLEKTKKCSIINVNKLSTILKYNFVTMLTQNEK